MIQRFGSVVLWGLLLAGIIPACADSSDFAALCADRTAVEHIYYNHRTGEKPPFEKVLPPISIERMVRQDLRKKAALKQVYGVEVTPAEIAAEVQRINSTTRAPETLAELKAALGGDTNRFARMVAEPVVVDRELRRRFNNDDSVHLADRQELEQVRAKLVEIKSAGQPVTNLVAALKQMGSNHVFEPTWTLGAPPKAETPAANPADAEIKKRFGPDARMISGGPPGARGREIYFEELPTPLRKVLAAQLNGAGDVSAVIEMPTGFSIYLAEDKTTNLLKAAALMLPKRRFDAWLASLDLAEANK